MKIRVDFVTNSSSSSFIAGDYNDKLVTVESVYMEIWRICEQYKKKVEYAIQNCEIYGFNAVITNPSSFGERRRVVFIPLKGGKAHLTDEYIKYLALIFDIDIVNDYHYVDLYWDFEPTYKQFSEALHRYVPFTLHPLYTVGKETVNKWSILSHYAPCIHYACLRHINTTDWTYQQYCQLNACSVCSSCGTNLCAVMLQKANKLNHEANKQANRNDFITIDKLSSLLLGRVLVKCGYIQCRYLRSKIESLSILPVWHEL